MFHGAHSTSLNFTQLPSASLIRRGRPTPSWDVDHWHLRDRAAHEDGEGARPGGADARGQLVHDLVRLRGLQAGGVGHLADGVLELANPIATGSVL